MKIKTGNPDNPETSNSIFNVSAWRYFISFYRGQYRRLILTSVVSAAQSLIIVPTLMLIRYIFDDAIPQGNMNLLIMSGLGIFIFRLVNSVISLRVRAINVEIITSSIFSLREDLLHKVYMFARSVYTQLDQKNTHTRIVQDTERLSNVSNSLVSRLMPALFTSLALCLILAFLNWFLLLIIASLFPLSFFASRYTARLVKKRVHIFQRAFEAFSKGTMFVLRYLDLTKIQTAEKQEIVRQTDILNELQTRTAKMIYLYAVNGHLQSTLTGLSSIIILMVGGYAVASHTLTLGEFISFYVAAGYLHGHVTTITTSIADIIAGNESVETLYRLAETHYSKPYKGIKQILFTGHVVMDSVSFQYNNHPVLKDINLHLSSGSRIAIVGPNGSGKSTLVQLLLGFYRPQSGCIYADNVPYDDIDVTYLRTHIGAVMQDPDLYSGTILENITYGANISDRKLIVEAARIAMADDFIIKLDDGYNTQIGEEGVLLSGGERQRIAIARAILRKPELLILDEPTNHLDGHAVKHLMSNIDALDDSPAILIISHDESVIKHADEIYTLTEGTLVRDMPSRAIK